MTTGLSASRGGLFVQPVSILIRINDTIRILMLINLRIDYFKITPGVITNQAGMNIMLTAAYVAYKID